MKQYLIITLFLLSVIQTPAVELTDIITPMPPAYRVGLSDEPEKKYVEANFSDKSVEKALLTKDTSKSDISELTYADLSIKQISKEISQDLLLSEKEMLGDLSMLWQGAASQSDTINFALYKLANPDADKPDEKSVKKVLSTIASMSTLVGAGMGNPIMAAGSLIGGNVLGIMSQDTKALNYKYTRVTDTDMIILVRKIEDLQQQTVDLYYNYMMSYKKLKMINKIVDERRRNYNSAQKFSREIIVISDAYYRTALDNQAKAKSDFFTQRAALEQFVGHDVFVKFEDEIKARDIED
ncbi:hypothetical protein IJF81_03405 [bacterium]|nr:hypothetical protein [bacterium]